jgi:hypothetical protein
MIVKIRPLSLPTSSLLSMTSGVPCPLVQTFQDARGPDEYTTRALQTSVAAATAAYTTFATRFQQWVTTLARGEGGLPLEATADFKVQNEKAAEVLIHAAGAAFFALLEPPPDSNTSIRRCWSKLRRTIPRISPARITALTATR